MMATATCFVTSTDAPAERVALVEKLVPPLLTNAVPRIVGSTFAAASIEPAVRRRERGAQDAFLHPARALRAACRPPQDTRASRSYRAARVNGRRRRRGTARSCAMRAPATMRIAEQLHVVDLGMPLRVERVAMRSACVRERPRVVDVSVLPVVLNQKEPVAPRRDVPLMRPRPGTSAATLRWARHARHVGYADVPVIVHTVVTMPTAFRCDVSRRDAGRGRRGVASAPIVP
jgi:hypothetical protein